MGATLDVDDEVVFPADEEAAIGRKVVGVAELCPCTNPQRCVHMRMTGKRGKDRISVIRILAPNYPNDSTMSSGELKGRKVKECF